MASSAERPKTTLAVEAEHAEYLKRGGDGSGTGGTGGVVVSSAAPAVPWDERAEARAAHLCVGKRVVVWESIYV